MKSFNMNFNEQDEAVRQDQVKQFLDQYKLSQYFDILINEGFDSILSLFDITESDLIALDVKRGHRRLIQRAIATARGVPISTPILINYGYDEPGISHMPKPGTIINNDNTTSTTTTTTTTKFVTSTNHGYSNGKDSLKKKNHPYYHYGSNSHKKRRQYVPSKPITAFDEYLNEVKVELNGMSIPHITEIAHERWNILSPAEKDKYEREALHANSDYVMDKFLLEDENDKVEP